ncbi:P-loop containing nucleoside triphosphate hydrolase protein [Phascolomyces articulosus]|uniref:Peroxisomal ATPase PEX6 n=1 Tax=Phascolomyces articulosus TaxID=60185 RepID=A0AAD5K4G6_9FUNG|nr:P-loop containing nucleoside triphosphate hydrolase protein [Phascolomyces articulosus]
MPLYTSASLSLQYHSEDDQFVTLSPALWDAIVPSEQQHNASFTVAVKVPCLVASAPVGGNEQSESSNKLLSFLAHAKKSEEGRKNDKYKVYASANLIKSIYGEDSLSRLDEEDEEAGEEENEDEEEQVEEGCLVQIKPAQLVELDELIIGALEPASFEFAQRAESELGSLFSSSSKDKPALIIRSGSKYTFDGGLKFRVLMTGPVQQGFMTTTEHTKVLAVDMSNAESSEVSTPVNGVRTNGNVPAFSMLDSPRFPDVAEPQEFKAHVLQRSWPESRIFPTPDSQQDDESRVYIGVKDLAKCGVFSGNWVLVSSTDSKKSRLCRVYGVDALDSLDDEDHNNESVVYVPPVLYFNLGLPLPPASTENATLCITRLTVPPPATGPSVAAEVTIARVASPTSMDKSLQSPLLEALKNWFEDKDRILCEGDLIAVPLDEETARLRAREEEDNGNNQGRRPTTMAYFKVTSLQEEREETPEGVHPSFYGSGRRIVPSRTKMVQTGIEHSRAPIGSLSHYYGFVNKIPLHRSKTAAYAQMRELVSSSLHPLGRDFKLSCNALVHGPRGGGKATLVREIAEDLGVHIFEFSVYDVVSETDAKTEVHLRAKFDKAAALTPCIVLIRSIEGLARKSAVVETGQEPLLATVLQECIENVNAAHVNTGYPVMVVSTTSDIEALPTSILGCFRHEVSVEAPDEKARLQILQNLTYDSPIAPDVSLSSLATQTAALVGKDLVDLVARSGVLALQRINNAIKQTNDQVIATEDIEAAGIVLTASDFDSALGEARASYSDSIGAPKIPSVTWDDVGGMAHVKDDILDTIQLPLEHPELFGAGLKKRSGILLYGPPGTGKTLLAKAIATSCSLNFFSVKGPELLNMYIGESEANVRRVFQRARDAKPCVVFFDELDSVAPKRGEKGDSGGVMDRIVSQLLAELDGMSEGGEGSGVGDVFVIGATNRPDLLDPALLRPGRFDKLLYLGVSQDHESQLRIIQALTRKFRLDPNLDLMHVAERCPFHYTGADFYALCSDAMLKAMTRVADTIEAKVNQMNEEEHPDLPSPVTAQYYLSRLATPEEIMVQVEEIDFVNALNELVPSVSATELEHYSKVRERFEQKPDNEEENDMEQDKKKREEEEEARRQQQPVKRKNKGKGKARAT